MFSVPGIIQKFINDKMQLPGPKVPKWEHSTWRISENFCLGLMLLPGLWILRFN